MLSLVVQAFQLSPTQPEINSKNPVRFQKTRKTLSSFKRGDQTTTTTNKQLTEAQQRPIEFKHPFGSQHFRLSKLCYVITKNLFCDLIRLRYGWNLTRILRRCVDREVIIQSKHQAPRCTVAIKNQHSKLPILYSVGKYGKNYCVPSSRGPGLTSLIIIGLGWVLIRGGERLIEALHYGQFQNDCPIPPLVGRSIVQNIWVKYYFPAIYILIKLFIVKR